LWIGGQYRGYASQAGSDNDFIAENFAAVTPVNLDPTDYNLIDKMKSWGIE
jgi:broad specificity polyphosphatase/5'/3'-nucleotidase SurE